VVLCLSVKRAKENTPGDELAGLSDVAPSLRIGTWRVTDFKLKARPKISLANFSSTESQI
jgi:hypothetical protein